VKRKDIKTKVYDESFDAEEGVSTEEDRRP
jgi:hypothetical protein